MLMRSRLLPMLLLWWCVAATCATAAPSSQAQAAPTHRAPDTSQLPATPSADAQCAHCHRAIYDSYEKTPMAKASGPAVAGLIPGEFTHTKSGVHYRLFVRDGQAWLDYDRPHAPPGRYLNGELPLDYFVGSGTRGRTYLFEQQGFWFETPVNWYGKQRVWDMAPNYLDAREMPTTLPVDPNCLHCHASGVQESLPGSRNHFANGPFLHGGVGCSACHGDAQAHLTSRGRAPVLNPARLAPARRDSVCLQCHLEGETAVYKQGRSLSTYKPGDVLFDDVAYFVHQGEIGPTGRATSQWEALLQSACRRASGDRLTCTTCHDPHASLSSATVSERAQYYRAKCLSCHTGAKFSASHHPEQPDCASCHMPRENSIDIAHEQVTDHRIQRRTTPPEQRAARFGELAPIGDGGAGLHPSDRELGLAYAQMAQRGDRASGERALPLLKLAEARESAPDAELHTELGFLEQMSGNGKAASAEYRTALHDPQGSNAAAGDLAVLEAHDGDYASAVKLWRQVFTADPTQIGAGFDLAVGECVLGDAAGAAETLKRVLLFSPDDDRARQLATALASGKQHCGARASGVSAR